MLNQALAASDRFAKSALCAKKQRSAPILRQIGQVTGSDSDRSMEQSPAWPPRPPSFADFSPTTVFDAVRCAPAQCHQRGHSGMCDEVVNASRLLLAG